MTLALCAWLVKSGRVRRISTDNSSYRLDEFLLSQASLHLESYRSSWIVGAAFDTQPVTDLLMVPADLNTSRLFDPLQPLWPPPTLPVTMPPTLDFIEWREERQTRLRPVVVGYFALASYHAISVSLALVDHTTLNYHMPGAGYRINTINHPLPRQPETVVMDKVSVAVV